MGVVGTTASRIRQMTFQRSCWACYIGQRVCCQLWHLIPEGEKQKFSGFKANSGGDQGITEDKQQGNSYKQPPTHMEIAIMLNVSRETVTRVFQSLQPADSKTWRIGKPIVNNWTPCRNLQRRRSFETPRNRLRWAHRNPRQWHGSNNFFSQLSSKDQAGPRRKSRTLFGNCCKCKPQAPTAKSP